MPEMRPLFVKAGSGFVFGAPPRLASRDSRSDYAQLFYLLACALLCVHLVRVDNYWYQWFRYIYCHAHGGC